MTAHNGLFVACPSLSQSQSVQRLLHPVLGLHLLCRCPHLECQPDAVRVWYDGGGEEMVCGVWCNGGVLDCQTKVPGFSPSLVSV